MLRVVRVGLVACIVQLAARSVVEAQPWVPEKGEGTATFTYQNYYVRGHFDPKGNENRNGATHSKVVVSEIDFGLAHSIGLTARLPFVASKYTGPSVYFVGDIPTYPGPLDDGTYHGALQDLYLEARRMFAPRAVVVAPFAGVTLPTHDYETHGEAVPGRHRRDLEVGASAAPDFESFLPHSYAYVRYTWAAAERNEGFPSVRSLIDLEGGHDLTSWFGVRGLLFWQIRHKGPTLDELHAHDWEGHDRFIVSSYFNVGGGTSLRLMRSTELSATWIATVSGKGGAHVGRMLAVSATWSFGGGFTGLGARPDITNQGRVIAPPRTSSIARHP